GNAERGVRSGIGNLLAVRDVEIEEIELTPFFHVRQELRLGRPAANGAVGGDDRLVTGRKALVDHFEIVHRQGHLLEVVAAGRAASRLAGKLDGWEEEGDEDADDSDDDEELDEGE